MFFSIVIGVGCLSDAPPSSLTSSLNAVGAADVRGKWHECPWTGATQSEALQSQRFRYRRNRGQPNVFVVGGL